MSGRNHGSLPDVSEHSPAATRTFAHILRVPEMSFEIANAAVLQEMARDWQSGRCTPAERWFERYPHLAENEETAVRIVYEEICLREEQGQTVDGAEMQRRFPQWASALAMLLDCHELIQTDAQVPSFPAAGQQLGELTLVRKLGSGALGQVFLATQPSLSDRPLVVKITPRAGDEHLSLARLQHTHIVPLYHVLDFESQNLRALCMPYVGGQSWSALLSAVKNVPASQRSGATLVEALAATGDAPATLPQRSGPALAFLSRATYVQSVCWIGACLADALHHAHQCGLVHFDIKPSNVLIAGDGQPMLLDFHLAQSVLEAGAAPPRRLGGTRSYMSPEQEMATAAVREGRALPKRVDGRSDVYSLGATLYESLVGRLPGKDEAANRRAWRSSPADSSRGLEDIVHKCLATDAKNRYADAGQLAADLRRHLADLPLGGVANRSLPERWRKWRKRKPHALVGGATSLALVLVTVVFLAAYARDREATARAALDQANQSVLRNQYDTAVEQLESGYRVLRWLPGQSELKRNLQTQLSAARQGRLAAVVGKLAEQSRFLDSYQSVSEAQLKKLDEGCQKLWAARDKLIPVAGEALSKEERDSLRSDLTDLVIAWCGLGKRRCDSEPTPAIRRQSLQRLAEAESLCGPSLALDLARREYQMPQNGSAIARPLPSPRTARDHVALGRYFLHNDQLSQAIDEFERAIDLEPGSFWPYFLQSNTAYRLHQYDRALDAANVCAALEPDSGPCFYNRAVCHQALGQVEPALRDFDRAIKLDPTLAVAWLQRGALELQQGKLAEARFDLEQALERGASGQDVRYQLPRLELACGDRAAARRNLITALASDANHAASLALLAELDKSQ